MRKQGNSYGEIMKVTNIRSKGTLNYWFKGIEINNRAKRRISRLTNDTQKKNLTEFNIRRTKNIIAENKGIFEEAEKKIGLISKRELLLIGSALYWGEGVNKTLYRGYQLVTFVNSDPNMVKIFMKFLREILGVLDENIKPGIIIHPNVVASEAKKYWSVVTGLSESSFWISVAVSKAGKHKRPMNSLAFGTIHLRVNNRRLFCRIRGYISGISNNK